MHFHLPKPLHGWREFAGEVGIIVIGVLIALGTEQLVEVLHWRHEVSQAKVALRGEMESEYLAASELAIAEPCVDKQLVTLEQALLAPGAYKPVPLYKEGSLEFTYRAPSRNWNNDIAQSVTTSGIATHFDQALQLQLAGLNGEIAQQRARGTEAVAIFFRMRILARQIELDPSTRASLGEQLEEARGAYTFSVILSNQIIEAINAMGFAPDERSVTRQLSTSGTLLFCKAHLLPLGKVDPQRPR